MDTIMQHITTFLQSHNIIKSTDPEWLPLAYVLVTLAGLLLVVQQFFATTTKPTPKITQNGNVPKNVLRADEWQQFKLMAKDQLTHNTALYKFQLPTPTSYLGLPIGQHISVIAEINGKNIMRSYTPTTLDDDLGHFDLVVKSYEQGNISKYLSLLKIGQSIKVKGPKGKFIYTPTLSPHLLMIAGGTGITPMYQIIRASLKDETDKTQMRLIYGNVEEADILLRKELEEMVKSSNGRLEVYHVLNKPPANWDQGRGFITREVIERYMPSEGVGAPFEGSKVLLCGPPPMITAMKANLAALGYPAPNTISKLEDQVFCF